MSPPTRQNRWPPYTNNASGNLYYRPRLPKDSPHPRDKSGFLTPPVRLGKDTDPPEKIWAAYTAAKAQLAEAIAATPRDTLRFVLAEYFASRHFLQLAPKTQRDHQRRARILDQQQLLHQGKHKPLGDVPLKELHLRHFQAILEKRLAHWQAQGKKGQAEANHELRLLSAAVTWALRYHDLGIQTNPLLGFQRLQETPRTRYVTDDEYRLQRAKSEAIAPYLRHVFDLAYLDAARGGEVLALKLADITAAGLILRRTKGSQDTLVEWSDALLQAVQEALDYHATTRPGVVPAKAAAEAARIRALGIFARITPRAEWLIPSLTGARLTQNTYQAAMQRLKARMEQDGQADIYWTTHDLKRKGFSEAEDEGITGHKSQAMRDRYRVQPKKVKAAK